MAYICACYCEEGQGIFVMLSVDTFNIKISGHYALLFLNPADGFGEASPRQMGPLPNLLVHYL